MRHYLLDFLILFLLLSALYWCLYNLMVSARCQDGLIFFKYVIVPYCEVQS